MINQKHILKAEFIGSHTKIINAKNKDLIGIEGTIVDETKHFITIKTEKETKMIQKNNSIFELSFKDKIFQINGSLVTKRPEERIKIK